MSDYLGKPWVDDIRALLKDGSNEAISKAAAMTRVFVDAMTTIYSFEQRQGPREIVVQFTDSESEPNSQKGDSVSELGI